MKHPLTIDLPEIKTVPPQAQIGDGKVLPCLSLWQPWASAIAVGLKQIETRSWGRHYHGPIAIQASARIMPEARPEDGSLRQHLEIAQRLPALDTLPLGAVVCIARVVKIIQMPLSVLDNEGEFGVPTYVQRFNDGTGAPSTLKLLPEPGSAERWLGGYVYDEDAPRFGWMLTDVMPLEVPYPLKAMQGLFKITGQDAFTLLNQYRSWCIDRRPKCANCQHPFGDPRSFKLCKGKSPGFDHWVHNCPTVAEDVWHNAAACVPDYDRCMPFLSGWYDPIPAPTLDADLFADQPEPTTPEAKPVSRTVPKRQNLSFDF